MSRIRLIQLRRGTAAQWTSANPTLASGEGGFETDTKKLKLGDGSTAWNSLAYIGGSGSGDVATDAIWDAKGDLAVGSGSNTADNLAVGTNGFVLTADSGQTLGVKWATPASVAPSGSAGGALDGTYPNPGLNATVAGAGLAETSDVLSVNVDGSTIEISSDSLRVKDGGITAAKVAADVATQAELDAHTGDTTDAHDASAISVADSGGYFTGTDVEAALAEIGAGTVGTSFGVEVPSGTVNGVNVTFTLSAAPSPAADLLLWKNGLLMKQGLDYTLSSATITFDSGNIPQTGDILLASVPTSAGGGGGGGGLLAVVRNVTGGTKTTTSTTQADVDATNSQITFTAPSSGNIVVKVSCLTSITSGVNNCFLGIRESTTDVINKDVAVQGVAASALTLFVSMSFYITGVSGGSHTYKLAFAVNGGAQFSVFQGSTTPVTLEVWEAP